MLTMFLDVIQEAIYKGRTNLLLLTLSVASNITVYKQSRGTSALQADSHRTLYPTAHTALGAAVLLFPHTCDARL